MITKEQIKNLGPKRDTVAVDVPGWPDSVRLRYPSFKEWHGIVSKMRGLDGKEPPAETVAATIATCIADEDGRRMLTDAEASVLMDQSHEAVMFLYTRCWETVLRADGKIEAAEKHS